LSLLGTFNAQDHSQQWNPSESSLPQVLLSIQTQLLTEDPYFNEPGHEAMRRTAAGIEASRSYNLKRSFDTLRYAIIEPLTNPSVGMEEIIHRHFAVCRLQVLAQARRWALEAKGTELAKKFDVVFDRLVAALHKIPENVKAKYPPLAPRPEDLRFLSNKRDSLFAHLYQPERPATTSRIMVPNPWASGTHQTNAFQSGSGDADIEDFYS
jgi:baculoviral IAP repeat-containing protein 6